MECFSVQLPCPVLNFHQLPPRYGLIVQNSILSMGYECYQGRVTFVLFRGWGLGGSPVLLGAYFPGVFRTCWIAMATAPSDPERFPSAGGRMYSAIRSNTMGELM